MALKSFFANSRGSVSFYGAMIIMTLVGSGALVADYGRMVVLKSQMQNYADSAVMAGAVFLDQSSSSITNATAAINSLTKQTNIGTGSNTLTLQSITFYDANGVATTTATSAESVGVVVSDKNVQFLFKPVLDLLTRTSGSTEGTVTALANGNPSPIGCELPPLMACDFTETLGSAYDLLSTSNIGKQIKLGPKSGTNAMAPGNFGILDTTDGSQSTQDIAQAMASTEPSGCYGSGIDTAPGSRVDAVRDGINARFDLPAPPQNFPDPARNVINYLKDTDISSNLMGSGSWNYSTYWAAKHPGVTAPTILGSNPSRYQVYLYELGEEFAINGKQTLYPAPESLPAGYTLVSGYTSPGVPVASSNSNSTNNDYDGVPSRNTPVEDPKRRLIPAVILNCVADNIQGNGGPYPASGRYVELFVTETVSSTAGNTIYGEIVGSLTPANSEKIKANVTFNQ